MNWSKTSGPGIPAVYTGMLARLWMNEGFKSEVERLGVTSISFESVFFGIHREQLYSLYYFYIKEIKQHKADADIALGRILEISKNHEPKLRLI